MIISVGTGETGELYALLCHYVMLYGVPCDMNVVLYYTGYNKGWCSFNMISEYSECYVYGPINYEPRYLRTVTKFVIQNREIIH